LPFVLSAAMRAAAFLSVLALWGLLWEWDDFLYGFGESPRWWFLAPLPLWLSGVWLVSRVAGRSVPRHMEGHGVPPQHGRRLRLFFLTHVTLTVAGTVWLCLRLHERRRWDLVMAVALPEAMERVSPSWDTVPAARFREGCALLAASLDLPADQVETSLVDHARELIAERKTLLDGPDPVWPAELVLSWLTEDPLHPQALNHREQAAWFSGCFSEFRALVALRRTVQAPDHPDLLRTRAFQARFLMRGKGDPAYPNEMRDIIRIRRTFQAPEDPALISLQKEFAQRLLSRGDYAGYEECVRELLAVCERMSGREVENDVRKWRFELADSLHKQGKLAEEEKERRFILAAAEAAIPTRASPLTIPVWKGARHLSLTEANRCRLALAQCLEALGKDDEAHTLAIEVMTEAALNNDTRNTYDAAKLVKKLSSRKTVPAP
jgi:hypothetical protein